MTQNPRNHTTKLLSRKELAETRERISAAGRRLVLTNGCFDLLHAGHVRYLQVARGLGDALAVGLNSDASVRRLKGRGRPLTTEQDRATVLAGLEVVDFVTVFDEDSAVELVKEVQPAIYVKGGDYDGDPSGSRYPPEADVVRSYGGEVKILEYVPGRSTTSLINQLRETQSGSEAP